MTSMASSFFLLGFKLILGLLLILLGLESRIEWWKAMEGDRGVTSYGYNLEAKKKQAKAKDPTINIAKEDINLSKLKKETNFFLSVHEEGVKRRKKKKDIVSSMQTKHTQMASSVIDDTTKQLTEVIATSSSLTTSPTTKMDTFTVGLNDDIGSSIDLLTTIARHHTANPVHSCIPSVINTGPMSSAKANLQILESNVLNDADYDVWLPLALIHKLSDRMKNSIYGYFIDKRLALPVVEWFVQNNWEKYGLKKGQSSYATILIESNACSDFSDNLVMVVPNLKGTGYTKETIRIEYE
ncbi:hypothetical protein Tco_0857959 [Tanacetum coccineum]|uniref:Uncharacterized protein n=1 Tax=Tanacetum coccineum TaxID=301880 RepID=A0ABQ5BB23_9ASTR